MGKHRTRLREYFSKPLKLWPNFIDHYNDSQQILRRYLQYIPQKIYERETTYPLVILLHGANITPELFKDFSIGNKWERLADQEAFMIAYANAYEINNTPAPDVSDDPYWANGGYWRTCVGGPAAGANFYDVDDVDYVFKIIEKMQSESLPIDFDRIYVVGESNGGEMAEHLARVAGDKIAAVGSVIPVLGMPSNIPLGGCEAGEQAPTSLIRIYSPQDTTLVPTFNQLGFDYEQLLQDSSNAWAASLGVDFSSKTTEVLPNIISEGEGYLGTMSWALETMNSYVERTDYDAAENGADFAELKLIRGGHGWPRLESGTFEEVENSGRFGFHNQDIEAVDVIWNFIKDKRKIK